MATQLKRTRQELLDALAQLTDVKAEIMDGEIVIMSPTAGKPSLVSGLIFAALLEYARRTGRGVALPNNAGFVVELPHRGSFSPDAAYTVDQRIDADLIQGAPVFAVEVRSKHDYGPAAERAIRAKIADYFAAGTRVVWDVDALHSREVRVYRATQPDHPTVYGMADEAEAEPAVPGWRVRVRSLLE